MLYQYVDWIGGLALYCMAMTDFLALLFLLSRKGSSVFFD
jgi:hypothetical protein